MRREDDHRKEDVPCARAGKPPAPGLISRGQWVHGPTPGSTAVPRGLIHQ